MTLARSVERCWDGSFACSQWMVWSGSLHATVWGAGLKVVLTQSATRIHQMTSGTPLMYNIGIHLAALYMTTLHVLFQTK